MKEVMQHAKRFNLFQIFMVLLTVGILSACNKEEEQIATVTEEDAVEVVENALKVESEGLVVEVEDAALVTEEYVEKTLPPCGASFDSTVVRNISNAYITADYTSNWNWTIICNNQNIPATLNFNRTTQGQYETTRLLSDDSAAGGWTIDNIILGDTYVINGVYSRQGNQESKVRNRLTFTSSVEFDLSDLVVDKDIYRILSGTATFTISGTSSGGGSFQYSGEIIFLGDGMATITLNGHTYTVDLY
ncbi:MAG: hypothetical protein DHS20C18_20380 [Saprospiraceae bacterium]|nr:MAG: hypothetical protein DHS20C18_20380 [Saprospiraceae bacterium]